MKILWRTALIAIIPVAASIVAMDSASFPDFGVNAPGISGDTRPSIPLSSDTPRSQQKQRAAQEGVQFKVDVSLVTVDAIVRGARGSLVGNLQSEDFIVLDNGVVQNVTHFSQDQLPIAVALLVDCSLSLALQSFKEPLDPLSAN